MPITGGGGGIISYVSAGSGYVGPGDIVSGASAWYGVRGYNAAYCTGSNPGMDVVDTATGLLETTINIKTDGSLDEATILGLGYAVSVKKWYDQTGNGLHITQAALNDMPALTTDAIGGAIPVVSGNDGAAALSNTTGYGAISQPWSLSCVFRVPIHGSFQAIFTGSDSATGLITNGNANEVSPFAGGTTSVAATDAAFHVLNFKANSNTTRYVVDSAAPATLDPGTNAWPSGTVFFNAASGRSGVQCDGAEIGFWATGISDANLTAIANNQLAYYGL